MKLLVVYDGKKIWPLHEIEFPRWSYVVPHKLLISYKLGLGLEEIRELGLPKFRPRPGDTFVPIGKATFERMKEALQKQEDFDWKDWLSKQTNEI